MFMLEGIWPYSSSTLLHQYIYWTIQQRRIKNLWGPIYSISRAPKKTPFFSDIVDRSFSLSSEGPRYRGLDWRRITCTMRRNLHLCYTKIIFHIILFFLEAFCLLFHSFIFMQYIACWGPSVLSFNQRTQWALSQHYLLLSWTTWFMSSRPQVPRYCF